MRLTNIGSFAVAGFAAFGLMTTFNTEAHGASATGTANATVELALAITGQTALNFGAFAGSSGATTVEINSQTGARGGTADLISTDTGARGTFGLSGLNSAVYNIDTSDTSVTLTGTGADMTATLTYFSDTDVSAIAPGGATGTLSGAGVDTVGVGGTLPVGINQAADSYTGTYNFVVAYE